MAQPGSRATPAAVADLPEIHVGTFQVMPDMTAEDFAALKADIAARGVISPIDIDETGAILDGHDRYRAWSELQRNEQPPVIVRSGLTDDEKRSFAIRQNIKRRHLTLAQNRARLDMLSHAERMAANRFNSLIRSMARTKGRTDAIEAAMAALIRDVRLPPVPEQPEAEERSETARPLVDSDWGYLGMVKAMKARKKYEDEE